ncbi:nitroreductase family protein [Pseudomonas stutzeri]|jgi:nitroreductase|uniref:nitroreductase family protein n=1 Tax=Stutzerimonas stutzeri TaxID=316 RepID=UPI001A918EDC|nr:nitroreductase family protein [Stutzerimonas stutzeri]MBO0643453.1 nitroreductase family protein [Stutzerimonas stutzeri]
MYGGKKYKVILRPVKSILGALGGFLYDFYMFGRCSAWNAKAELDAEARNYFIAKIYHRLEKGLSFKVRKFGSGWQDVTMLIDVLERIPPNSELGFHEARAVLTAREFIRVNKHENPSLADQLNAKLLNFPIGADTSFTVGSENITLEEFNDGVLADPEKFFFSRRSLRDFNGVKIEQESVFRAIQLALRSPSVCNRQAWHVYHMTDEGAIATALSFQNGNRGFGTRVPSLLIITADLTAFDSGNERYQHWIDGGIFSMGLVLALHSLGIASCCLNWSVSPLTDMSFRKAVPIQRKHSVIMMLAIGYPEETNKVCCSPRRPVSEVYTHIKEIQ